MPKPRCLSDIAALLYPDFMNSKETTPYIGRFAPSPSGPLHFGSLVAALASYLDAKAASGQWLVRMEDIDPPREQIGAADTILKALELYGLYWDGDVMYQSDRSKSYDDAIEQLGSKDLVYRCTCTRKDLRGHQGVYPGFCRSKNGTPNQPHSLRVKCSSGSMHFQDLIQGNTSLDLSDLGDFIIKRKDGLFAYQLAVTVDDAFQGITHIVRGSDLLHATPWQIYLQSLMTFNTPVYAHIPVITLEDGDKLSKQNHAPDICQEKPEPLLIKALSALGQEPDKNLNGSSITDIVQWGVDHWQLDKVSKQTSTPLASLP